MLRVRDTRWSSHRMGVVVVIDGELPQTLQWMLGGERLRARRAAVDGYPNTIILFIGLYVNGINAQPHSHEGIR